MEPKHKSARLTIIARYIRGIHGMEVVFSLGLVAVATTVMLNLGSVAGRSPFSVSELHYVNAQLKYQVLLFCVALGVLLILLLLHEENIAIFLASGNLEAQAESVWWLGIDEGMSWLGVGVSLSFVITLGTGAFVYLQFRKSGAAVKELIRYLPWVLLFALSNSFSEEVVYRLGIIVPLYGTIDPGWIMMISAVVFGAPHLRGMPNGLVGAFMAGFLGWLLAKSVLETHGIFWAWLIHFIQDVVIFSAFVMAAANKLKPSGNPDPA